MPATPYTFGSGPVGDAFAVTPSDTVFHSQPARGFYVGVAGNVAVVTPQGSVVTFVGCAAGAIYEIANLRINATNTTATSIVGLV